MKSSKILKLEEKLKTKDLSKKPVCHECLGTGKIRVGCHWYSAGTEQPCDYCKGTGRLYWANDITKKDLIRSAKQKLTIDEQKAVGLI